MQYSWIKHRECFIKFKTWGETLFLQTWFTFSVILGFSISQKKNPAKKKKYCFADLKRAIKQSLFPLHLLCDRPFTLPYFFIKWSGSSTLYWQGWPPWFLMYWGGGGGHCGLHLHRPWPLKYTVNLTLTGSKMAVHNTKCSIKTIIRKIGDCEQSTLRLLFMRFEVQSIQLLVTKNSNLWPGQSQLKAINSFVS